MLNYPVAHMLTISQGKRASFAHFLISKHQPIIFDGFLSAQTAIGIVNRRHG